MKNGNDIGGTLWAPPQGYKKIGLHKKNVIEGAKIPSNSRQTIALTHILQLFLKECMALPLIR